MNITKTREAEQTNLFLSGRLDSDTSPKMLETILQELESASCITLNFSDVAYVSSAGLRVLLQGHKAAIAKDGSLELCDITADVMEVLDSTGFADVLNIKHA